MFPIGSDARRGPGPGGSTVDHATILDALPDAVFVHDPITGRILEVNRACLEMFRVSPEALAMIDLQTLSAWEEGFTLEEAQARIARAREDGASEFSWRSRRADGTYFWSEVRLTHVPGEDGGQVIAVVRDVTAAAQAEEALRLAEEKFEKIFRSSPASILVARFPDGRVEEANETVLRLTGFSRSEIIGSDGRKLWVVPEDRERYLATLRAHGRVEGLESQFRMKSGEVKVGRISGELLELSGGLNILTVIEDITEEREAQAALARITRLYAALSQVNQYLIRATSPGELFASICRALVEGGGFWAAWIAEPDPVTHWFVPLAIHGGTDGWVEGLRVYSLEGPPEGMGTMGRAYRQHHPIIANDFDADPLTAPWKDEGRTRGFKAAASFPLRRGDGGVFGVLCIYAREPGFFGPQEIALLEEVCEDLTFALEDLNKEERRKRAEAEQDRLQELLHSIIDSTPDLIYAKDRNHRYLLVNRALSDFLGREPREIIGRHDAELWPEGILPGSGPQDKLGLRLDEAEALFGEVMTREVAMVPPRGGEARVFDTLIAPLKDSRGAISGVLGYARDITRMKEQEAQKRDLELRLQQSQKLESLGTLAGGVAHDVNNVLGAVLSLASIEQERALPSSPTRRSMETIVQACTRGREVVQGLLCFARRDLGEIRPTDLNQLVREIVGLLGRTTLQRVQFVTDFDPGLRSVEGDAGALNHALMNICVNAVDAMPDGGTITLRTRNLPGGAVAVEIEDTGEGMAENVVQRAAEPFFTTKPPGKGTGLGLAMVYGTVQAHKGAMTISSRPGEGTLVRLSFPGSDIRPAPEAKAAAPAPPRGLRILLVDDDELIREAAPELLGLLGHHVIIAGSGTAGLEALESDPDIDVVILDVNMPDMDGEETLARIRERWPELPVVLATGYLREDLKAAISPGSRVFSLPKPYTLEEARRALVEATRPVEGPLFS